MFFEHPIDILTIDTLTTVILVLAIGFTVDYSVHIAIGFMMSRDGNKDGNKGLHNFYQRDDFNGNDF